MSLLDKIRANQSNRKAPILTGSHIFNSFINSVDDGYCVLTAESKAGKTTLMNWLFILSIVEKDIDVDIQWVYYSFEINKLKMQAKFISYFMYKTWGERVSANYVMGNEVDQETKQRKIISAVHWQMIEEVYDTWIVPLFGGRDKSGAYHKGKIIFFEGKENPTGISNFMKQLLSQHGKIHEQEVEVLNELKEIKTVKVFDYYEKKTDTQIVLLIDHPRKLKKERGFSMKENLDKIDEYLSELYKDYFVFCVSISHSNRGVTDVERIKHAKDKLFITPEDVKDSGNAPESCSIFMSIFSPRDKKYNIASHFNKMDGTPKLIKNESAKRYRTLHIPFLRDGEGDKHMCYYLDGLVGDIIEIEELQ